MIQISRGSDPNRTGLAAKMGHRPPYHVAPVPKVLMQRRDGQQWKTTIASQASSRRPGNIEFARGMRLLGGIEGLYTIRDIQGLSPVSPTADNHTFDVPFACARAAVRESLECGTQVDLQSMLDNVQIYWAKSCCKSSSSKDIPSQWFGSSILRLAIHVWISGPNEAQLWSTR